MLPLRQAPSRTDTQSFAMRGCVVDRSETGGLETTLCSLRSRKMFDFPFLNIDAASRGLGGGGEGGEGVSDRAFAYERGLCTT